MYADIEQERRMSYKDLGQHVFRINLVENGHWMLYIVERWI